MIINDVIYGTIESKLLPINENEIIARIGQKLDDGSLQYYLNLVNSVAVYRYAYVRTNVSISGRICNLGFSNVESDALAKVFTGCNEAIVMVVSLGTEVDRLITRLNVQDPADAYIVDGIASAMVESLANYVNSIICEGISATKRFSPGYGDFPLEFQIPLLERLNAYHTTGVTLNESLLMIPMKSISAVIGIK